MILPLQHLEEHSPSYGSDVSIIRREFVELTGNLFSAVILNQLLYWTLRVKDFDYLLEEEKRFQPHCNVSPRHGWIYKTAQELNEETMLGLSPPSIRKYLKLLIDESWIDEREHPTEKWNKTTQYRVNIRRLQEDLVQCGQSLPEIYLKAFRHALAKCSTSNDLQSIAEKTEEMSKQRNFVSNEKTFASNESSDASFGEEPHFSKENLNQRIFDSNEKDFGSNEKIFASNERNFGSNEKFFASNTENTTETIHKNINKDHQQRPRARENFSNLEKMLVGESAQDELIQEKFVADKSVSDELELNKDILDKPAVEPVLDKHIPGGPVPDDSVPGEPIADEPVPGLSVAQEMASLWERHVGEKVPQLTEERQGQLESLFAFHFQNDIRLWERFCLRVKATPFLMGGGPRKWIVTLKWIGNEENLSKVLAGKYENSHKAEQQASFEHKLDHIQANAVRDAEKAAIIASITDPVWKNWCTRLTQGVRLNDFRMLHWPLSALELQEIANASFIECEDERLVWIGSPEQKVLNKIEDLRLKINWVFAKEYPKATTLRTRLMSHSTKLTNSSTSQGQALKGGNSHE